MVVVLRLSFGLVCYIAVEAKAITERKLWKHTICFRPVDFEQQLRHFGGDVNQALEMHVWNSEVGGDTGVCVCMCVSVCMCVHIHVCLCVYICLFLCAHAYVYMCVCMYVYVCGLCVYAHLSVFVCV